MNRAGFTATIYQCQLFIIVLSVTAMPSIIIMLAFLKVFSDAIDLSFAGIYFVNQHSSFVHRLFTTVLSPGVNFTNGLLLYVSPPIRLQRENQSVGSLL